MSVLRTLENFSSNLIIWDSPRFPTSMYIEISVTINILTDISVKSISQTAASPQPPALRQYCQTNPPLCAEPWAEVQRCVRAAAAHRWHRR